MPFHSVRAEIRMPATTNANFSKIEEEVRASLINSAGFDGGSITIKTLFAKRKQIKLLIRPARLLENLETNRFEQTLKNAMFTVGFGEKIVEIYFLEKSKKVARRAERKSAAIVA
jgi:hypothetical protein